MQHARDQAEIKKNWASGVKTTINECERCKHEIKCEDCAGWLCFNYGEPCPFETGSCRIVLASFIDRLFYLDELKNAGYWFPREHLATEMIGMIELQRIRNELMAEDMNRARE